MSVGCIFFPPNSTDLSTLQKPLCNKFLELQIALFLVFLFEQVLWGLFFKHFLSYVDPSLVIVV